MSPGVHRAQARMSNSLEPEWEAVVSLLIWVLGVRLRFSVRTVYTCNHWAIYPALKCTILISDLYLGLWFLTQVLNPLVFLLACSWWSVTSPFHPHLKLMLIRWALVDPRELKNEGCQKKQSHDSRVTIFSFKPLSTPLGMGVGLNCECNQHCAMIKWVN